MTSRFLEDDGERRTAVHRRMSGNALRQLQWPDWLLCGILGGILTIAGAVLLAYASLR